MVEASTKYGELGQLPQFPAVATKLMRVLSNDESSIDAIAKLVRVDSALSAELLRVVNSPLYALSTQIASIRKAVIVLGLEEVKRHALAASMRLYFRTAVRLDLLRGIWRHSLACALVAEELSAVCSPSQTPDDRVYTAALLHDIGRLGLFVAHPEEYSALLTRGSGPLREREIQTFGYDHCEAGEWLASQWGLPADIQSAASGHHNPPRVPISDQEGLVQVGILLSDFLGFDVLPAEHSYKLGEIRALLPRAAQYRFDPEPEALQARITEKLNAFD